MRTPETMLAAIRLWVEEEARVRVALLNGSRAVTHPAPDLLSDYDLLLGVTDVAAFDTGSWLGRFGGVRLFQRPHPEPDEPPGRSAWLVVFGDGVRIDFTFVPLAQIVDAALGDSRTLPLVDKDGRLPPLPPPSSLSYISDKPTRDEYAACANEFWWVALYVAKGLWRCQLPYARYTFEAIVRPELEKMLVWSISHSQGWSWNPGKYNCYLPEGMSNDFWQAYVTGTYAGATIDAHWDALIAACLLMFEVESSVARNL